MQSQAFDPNVEQVGCIYGMPNEAYHSHPAISHSKLWTFHQRPKKFEGKYITKELEEKSTPAMTIGSGSHSIILEPWEDFQKNYACLRKEMDWRSKAGKLDAVHRMCEVKDLNLSASAIEELAGMKREDIENYFQMAGGRTILLPEQMDLIRIIRDKVRAHPEAKVLLADGVGEVTFRSPKLKLGYQVQCRFDWLNVSGCALTEGRGYGFDVKTVNSLEDWEGQFIRMGYYRAYPFYCKVQEIALGTRLVDEWFWVIIEKNWPYAVMVRHAPKEIYDRGMGEVTKDMEALAECLARGHFPDPGDGGITEQILPDWMLTTSVREPGLRSGPEYVPIRNYEYQEGWTKE